MRIAKPLRKHLHLLPIEACSPSVDFLVNIAFDDQAEHPKLFVRSKERVSFQFTTEFGRSARQVVLFDARANQS
jgi:hypothetical protein